MGTCFQREYMCEFIDSGAGVFDRDLIEAAFDPYVKALRFD